jgi:hypothetical protein
MCRDANCKYYAFCIRDLSNHVFSYLWGVLEPILCGYQWVTVFTIGGDCICYGLGTVLSTGNTDVYGNHGRDEIAMHEAP